MPPAHRLWFVHGACPHTQLNKRAEIALKSIENTHLTIYEGPDQSTAAAPSGTIADRAVAAAASWLGARCRWVLASVLQPA